MTMNYDDYVQTKLSRVPPTGIPHGAYMPDHGMFPHQSALVSWACKRGRAAIFADTGLGKSRMQLAWAEAVRLHTGRPVLILAPLAVAPQTVSEGAEIGVSVLHCRDGSDYDPSEGARICITNYDRLHRFDCSIFGAVVLDESSCIKHHDAKTLRTLLTAFRNTPFKLCATATPAPNDWTELGTHAEFLGVCTRAEMLAEYFTHDGGDTSVWRLKGHARHIFWQWVSQWGAMVRRPSDLGFDDSAYALPPLHLHEHTVETEMPLNGMLFAAEAQTLSERRDARRMSIADRVNDCASTIYGEWHKLAAPNNQGAEHGMEEGVRGDSQAQVSVGPGVQGKAKRTVGEGQVGASGIHGGVLRGQPGEVQADCGAAGGSQCAQTGEVFSGCRGPRCGASCCESMAAREPSEAESAEAEAVRDRSFGLQRIDGGSGRIMCDLRGVGYIEAEQLSFGGPLPQDREGPRAALHVLQSGPWEIQGRRGSAVFGDFVPDEAWLIWCDLNDEQDMLEKAFGDLAFSVRGSNTTEEKEVRIQAWLARQRPVMISKPSIMGFGLNFQHCRNMAFVGVTDSFESYYQAVRRCWRFGQRRDVHVHVFVSSSEGAVVANLKRKERDATKMAESLSQETRDAVMQEVTGTTRQTNIHNASQRVIVPAFLKVAT